ncbi:MAG: Maf family protein [Burkholderiaceae bacterium]|jgi:septum formation protein|nr:septum formation inhibitor Maf [Burkholderiales bacterium]NCV84573.1 septum formation inhibitor Maf [Oxalobacteraceae bacterium]NCW86352.1 septum formation inhibitor Maf [Oxalobacteraceae bacterium]NDG08289.1 septum formation inhibitor Maf [Oxalobacteraceae bacterium]
MIPSDQKIYLASKSPRRRELLRQIGVDFEILMLRDTPGRAEAVSEIPHPNEDPEVYVRRVAREKGEAGWQTVLGRKLPLRPVLSADTTVSIDGKILGKPSDANEAMKMLRWLSGRTHHVLTAITVTAEGKMSEALSRSEVRFAHLDETSLRAYCATKEPYDKAGAYGVQGYAAQFIEFISGSYSGIMGLPLFETSRLLQRVGIKTL